MHASAVALEGKSMDCRADRYNGGYAQEATSPKANLKRLPNKEANNDGAELDPGIKAESLESLSLNQST
eukprot:1843590-Amphidinium_carterae.3